MTLVLVGFSSAAVAQPGRVRQILSQLDQAVLTLKQGQFTLHEQMTKRVSDDQPIHHEHIYQCYLKRNRRDSLIGYQLAARRDDGYQLIYDGIRLFTVYDQTLEVMSRQAHPGQIQEQIGGEAGPNYIATTQRMLHYFNQPTTAHYLRFVGRSQVGQQACYQLSWADSSQANRRSEVMYYLSVRSGLPLRTVTKLTSTVGKAQETVIFDYFITGFQTQLSSRNPFSRDRLTDYRLEKNYDPAEEEAQNALLPLGSRAPDWTLPLIAGKTLSLRDLKGKFVILDFWFKACAPCQKQLLSLQALHEKYGADQVAIVGINTIDDPAKDKLALFLKNRLVTMSSVYQGHLIQSLYKVYGSPALFVLDKQGTVIYTASGYSSTLIKEVDQLLIKQLGK